MTNTNNEFLRPCDIEECKRTQQYFNRVLIPDDIEKLSALMIEWGY